jgi:thioredoxin reductase
MTEFDVIIIGGSAAGLSAALVLTRARRNVLVVDSGLPRNRPAAHMHGFLTRDGMPPRDLIAAGRKEVESYGGTILSGTATDAVTEEMSGFRVAVGDRGTVRARRLLVATGLRDEIPDIPGLRDRWGQDVLHCPYCHGFEVRDQKLAVLGGSSVAVEYSLIVRQWTRDLTHLTSARTLTDAEHERLEAREIRIAEGKPQRVIVRADRLQGIELADGRVVPCAALFVPPRFIPNNTLLSGLGCGLDEDGWAITGPNGLTTVPGVWVAGNVANPRAQVITAAGEGSAAAIAINADLVEEDVTTAIRASNPGPGRTKTKP